MTRRAAACPQFMSRLWRRGYARALTGLVRQRLLLLLLLALALVAFQEAVAGRLLQGPR